MGTSSGSSKFDFQAYGRTPASTRTVPMRLGSLWFIHPWFFFGREVSSRFSALGGPDLLRPLSTGDPTAAFWRERFPGLRPLLPPDHDFP